jgi:hypothetical protein
MRWPIMALAVLLLAFLPACDFGLAADEEVTVEGVQTSRGTIAHVPVGPIEGLIDGTAPFVADRAAEEEETPAQQARREPAMKLPVDEETPSHFPGVGVAVRVPPPPCPPPKAGW